MDRFSSRAFKVILSPCRLSPPCSLSTGAVMAAAAGLPLAKAMTLPNFAAPCFSDAPKDLMSSGLPTSLKHGSMLEAVGAVMAAARIIPCPAAHAAPPRFQ